MKQFTMELKISFDEDTSPTTAKKLAKLMLKSGQADAFLTYDDPEWPNDKLIELAIGARFQLKIVKETENEENSGNHPGRKSHGKGRGSRR